MEKINPHLLTDSEFSACGVFICSSEYYHSFAIAMSLAIILTLITVRAVCLHLIIVLAYLHLFSVSSNVMGYCTINEKKSERNSLFTSSDSFMFPAHDQKMAIL